MEEGNFDLSSKKECALLFLFEFIGTSFLLIAINFTNHHPVIVGCGIFMGVMVAGRRTGGHFNFGVTLGVYIQKAQWVKNIKALVIYALAELSGAYFGMAFSLLVLGTDGINIFRPTDLDYNQGYVFFIELFFTFTFQVVIQHSKNSKVSLFDNMVLGAGSVVGAIYFSINCAGRYTGAALNPTIGFTNLTFVAIAMDTNDYIKFLPAYVFGPLIGGALAGIFTAYASARVIHDPTQQNQVRKFARMTEDIKRPKHLSTDQEPLYHNSP
ncbi:mip family channel protein [Stylonychia lemnae]|uniref:Mip family channel protein n=1 Tax=Stylonychia lemnae TaxID=5949 RepID=A0A078AZQ5_STYLE|nr:mip family channel protein [Stylonychia lemnae]|eukprot:CDW87890.1 mip family channel protein [Stylonychia lemnae]